VVVREDQTDLDRQRILPLDGATEWLNSEPLGPAELRHYFMLVDFWTFTCINWLPTEPYIRARSQAYRDDGRVRGLRLVALTLRPR
jgi:hypothetical protein